MKQFSQQTENINQDNLTSTRLDEDTAAEFQQLSCSVNRMLDRLALSFDLQRQFAGNAAHELRTPLAMMQTKLELFAEEHSNINTETAELVQFQMDQVDRLTALVRTLLEMSNLQSVSRSDEIELAPLIDEILTDLTTLAEQKNITFHQNCEDICMIGSDTLIYRLLFNLIENAIKYNHAGGSVTVSDAAREPSGFAAYCRHRLRHFGRISGKYFPAIFSCRAKSRSRQMGGVGLGLALVREIAVLHGGSVCVESSSEEGNNFCREIAIEWRKNRIVVRILCDKTKIDIL